MRSVFCWLSLLFVLVSPLRAQRVSLDSAHVSDTSVVHLLRLRDGSTLIGHVTAVAKDSVHIQTRAGAMAVARTDIREFRESPRARLKNGEYWFENPHATRLLFSPTAFPVDPGTGYFSDIYLFFVGAQYGINSRFSMGGGVSLFPTSNFGDNLFYLTPKVTLADTPHGALSLGGFLGWLGAAADEGENGSLGILYGVASTGSRDTNLSLGLGWGYFGGEIAHTPVVMLGGQGRVSRRFSFISENWIVHTNGNTEGAISYGARFLGERMTVDLAFVNSLTDQHFFPGWPFVGFAVRY